MSVPPRRRWLRIADRVLTGLGLLVLMVLAGCLSWWVTACICVGRWGGPL